jgi:hypothetical protein
MLTNGGSDGPNVTPLGVQLDSAVDDLRGLLRSAAKLITDEVLALGSLISTLQACSPDRVLLCSTPFHPCSLPLPFSRVFSGPTVLHLRRS